MKSKEYYEQLLYQYELMKNAEGIKAMKEVLSDIKAKEKQQNLDKWR